MALHPTYGCDRCVSRCSGTQQWFAHSLGCAKSAVAALPIGPGTLCYGVVVLHLRIRACVDTGVVRVLLHTRKERNRGKHR